MLLLDEEACNLPCCRPAQRQSRVLTSAHQQGNYAKPKLSHADQPHAPARCYSQHLLQANLHQTCQARSPHRAKLAKAMCCSQLISKQSSVVHELHPLIRTDKQQDDAPGTYTEYGMYLSRHYVHQAPSYLRAVPVRHT